MFRFALLLTVFSLHAAVKLPAVIGDHMVLERGAPVPIWGWAAPGEDVRVEIQGQSVAVKASPDSRWIAWLRPLTAAGPAEIKINDIVLHDVLIGEVWLASGQSNMEFKLQQADNYDQEIAAAGHPLIHLFQVKRKESDTPLDDVAGEWQVCSPESARTFSAAAYFFGRHLQQDLHVPIGLIESDWGGTPAQSWTSHQALAADPALKFILDHWAGALAKYPAAKEAYDQKLAAWKQEAAQARAAGKTPPRAPGAPEGPGHQNTPAGLWNGMIAPLVPYAIRGVIWYQGESNANSDEHAYQYRRLFPDMIEDWRNRWGEGDFPFLFVQLANYETNGRWPVLRESQSETLRLAHTGMAVIVDIGNPHNIHPTDKQDVGLRLALAARAIAYHEPIEYSGPLFRTAAVEGARLRVYFTHAAGMTARGGGEIRGFEVAGADGNYSPATATIEGDAIVVASPSVAAPLSVRYGWADNPDCNLVNQAGLPASPFRSQVPRYGW